MPVVGHRLTRADKIAANARISRLALDQRDARRFAAGLVLRANTQIETEGRDTLSCLRLLKAAITEEKTL
jgi:hypothetical protein